MATLIRHQATEGFYLGRDITCWEVRFADGFKAVRKILEPVQEGS